MAPQPPDFSVPRSCSQPNSRSFWSQRSCPSQAPPLTVLPIIPGPAPSSPCLSTQAPPLTALPIIQGSAPHCPAHHPRLLLSPPCLSPQAPPPHRPADHPRPRPGPVPPAALECRQGSSRPSGFFLRPSHPTRLSAPESNVEAAVCRGLHHGKSEHHARTSGLRGGGWRRGGIPARPRSSYARALTAARAALGLNRSVPEPKPEARRVGPARGSCPRAARRPWG